MKVIITQDLIEALRFDTRTQPTDDARMFLGFNREMRDTVGETRDIDANELRELLFHPVTVHVDEGDGWRAF